MNSGLVALWFSRGSGPLLLRNPITLLFSRGSGPPEPTSGSVHGILLFISLFDVGEKERSC